MKKQGYNARLDESLGERNRKKKSRSKTKRTTKKSATLSPDINQHKLPKINNKRYNIDTNQKEYQSESSNSIHLDSY